MHCKNIIIIAKHKIFYKLIYSIKANQTTRAICVHFMNIHIYVKPLMKIPTNTFFFFSSQIYPKTILK